MSATVRTYCELCGRTVVVEDVDEYEAALCWSCAEEVDEW